MTHEPECPAASTYIADTCRCGILRAAYHRGREDAAEAVERIEWWQGRVETHNGPEYGRHCDQDLAIAAARGEGEQA